MKNSSKLIWWIVGVVLLCLIVFGGWLMSTTKEVDYTGSALVVEKRVTSASDVMDPEYKKVKTTISVKTVRAVGDVVYRAKYETTKVDMARPADYRFAITQEGAKTALYEMWKEPKSKRVEIVVDAESKYVRLSEQDSAIVWENVVGEDL